MSGLKDTDKVELTVGKVKEAAASCETAKGVLKKMFPEVFEEPEEEWEDMTGKMEIGDHQWAGGEISLVASDRRGMIDIYPDGSWKSYEDGRSQLKVERSRIWRRKL